MRDERERESDGREVKERKRERGEIEVEKKREIEIREREMREREREMSKSKLLFYYFRRFSQSSFSTVFVEKFEKSSTKRRRSGVDVITHFYILCSLGQNKLECLPMATFFSPVYLSVWQGNHCRN